MSEQSLAEGTIFDERYVIKSVAGRGGMATVYRAFHKSLGRDVALKVLNDDRHVTPDEYKRFKQEAHLVSTLSHPNITAVNAVGLFENRPYVAFEFLEGVSLASYIAEHKGVLEFHHFLSIFRQICDGLQCAHSNNVVHRDLKPENVFLVEPDTDNETVKIVDFGIAKALQQGIGKPAQKLTATGSVMGTPLYMSPEQCTGLGVDARSDIYAIGCIMYYCLMKQPPFDGDSFYQVMYAHGNTTAPQVVLPAGYLEGLRDMIAKCMSKSPADRYQTVTDLRADLDALSRGAPVSARPLVTTDERKTKAPSPKHQAIGAGITALAVLAVGAALALPHRSEIRTSFALTFLEPQWTANKYSETAKQVADALADNDRDFAEDLALRASHAAYKHPTVEAASGLSQIADAFKATRDPGIEVRRWHQKATRVLRFMPFEEWKKPAAISVLRDVVSNKDTGTPAAMAGALIHWIKWQSKVHDFVLQNLVVDHVDTMCGGVEFPFSAFKDLHGNWGQVGIIGEQWQMAKLKSAEHISRILFEHVGDYPESEGPTALYSTEVGRAGSIESALLADIPRDQQNMAFLERLLEDKRLKTSWTKIPLFLQYAEENFFGTHPDITLQYLQMAEKTCDELLPEHPNAGLGYYGMIGDGYECLGRYDDARRAYNKVLTALKVYQDLDAPGDYGSGRLWYAIAHAHHFLGDDRKAFEAATRAEQMMGHSGRVRNAFRGCFDLWMLAIETDRFAFAGTTGEMRNTISKEMARAAFHAIGGRFSDTVREMRHVSMMLHAQKKGYDADYVMPFRVGAIAASVAAFDEIAEECLKDAVAHCNGGFKRDARLYLAQLYSRNNRHEEALQLVHDAAMDCGEDRERWRVSRTRLVVTYAARDWERLGGAFHEMEKLNKRFTNYQAAQDDWVDTWREVYAYSLRQLGKNERADEIVDKIDAGLGLGNGQNSVD